MSCRCRGGPATTVSLPLCTPPVASFSSGMGKCAMGVSFASDSMQESKVSSLQVSGCFLLSIEALLLKEVG